jgi:hypothetical protein
VREGKSVGKEEEKQKKKKKKKIIQVKFFGTHTITFLSFLCLIQTNPFYRGKSVHNCFQPCPFSLWVIAYNLSARFNTYA